MIIPQCSRVSIYTALTYTGPSPRFHPYRLASSQFPVHSTYVISGVESSIGLPGALPLLLSGKLLPTLQESAEMSPILRRFSPTVQTDLCSPLCVANTYTS